MGSQVERSAPAAPALGEARELARDEYDWQMIDGRPCLLSRGGDGGMHWRGTATSREAAQAWTDSRREGFAERAAAGELTHVVYWNPARGRWEAG